MGTDNLECFEKCRGIFNRVKWVYYIPILEMKSWMRGFGKRGAL